MLESWRSESPQRYSYHSNFRRGADSQRTSPTRHSSVSPDRYKSALGNPRWSSLSRGQPRSHVSSHSSSHLPSRHTSRRSSPSRRRGSTSSRPASPSRLTPSHSHSGSFLLHNGDSQRLWSRDSRSPSQASHKHSLDSEKLYRNLESISRRATSAADPDSHRASQASPQTRTAVNSSANTRSRNSREVSPSRHSYSTHTPQRLSPPQGSWQGSSHSILSLPPSSASPKQGQGMDSQGLCAPPPHVAVTERDKSSEGKNPLGGERSRSSFRRGMDTLLMSEPEKAAVDVEEVNHQHVCWVSNHVIPYLNCVF